MGDAVFVTGATGFIGSHLVLKLISLKKKVVGFVPKGSSHPLLKNVKYTKIEGDIRDFAAVKDAMKGCSEVYHLVGITSDRGNRDEMFEVNINGTDTVLKAALELKVKKVVHVSSTSVLGFSTSESKKLTEKDNIKHDDSYYGQSKMRAEDVVQDYASKGLNVTMVNPCSVFGAGEVVPFVCNLFRSILSNRIWFAYSGGTCFVAVQDVISGMILAMKKGKKGERYILSSEYMRFIERYNRIAAILDRRKIKIELPKITTFPLMVLAFCWNGVSKKSPITPQGIRSAFGYRNYDASKAEKELEWKPTISFEESVKDAYDYYKKNKMLG